MVQPRRPLIGRQEDVADWPLVLIAVGVLPFGFGVDAYGQGTSAVFSQEVSTRPERLST
jgi:hypothetical protein